MIGPAARLAVAVAEDPSARIIRLRMGNTWGIPDQTDFAGATGEVLREIREGRSLSLRQVTVRSGGRFKPSSVASYERGERQISLERLFGLAGVYGVPPERIVEAIVNRLEHAGNGARVPARPLRRP